MGSASSLIVGGFCSSSLVRYACRLARLRSARSWTTIDSRTSTSGRVEAGFVSRSLIRCQPSSRRIVGDAVFREPAHRAADAGYHLVLGEPADLSTLLPALFVVAVRAGNGREVRSLLLQLTDDFIQLFARLRLGFLVRLCRRAEIDLRQTELTGHLEGRLVRIVGRLHFGIGRKAIGGMGDGIEVKLDQTLLARAIQLRFDQRLLVPFFGQGFFEHRPAGEIGAHHLGEGGRILGEHCPILRSQGLKIGANLIAADVDPTHPPDHLRVLTGASFRTGAHRREEHCRCPRERKS